VNEELRQDASTSTMIYGVAELIELMSSVVALEPGDVIATGTPAGVGPVVPGDVIVVEIARVGRLEVPVHHTPCGWPPDRTASEAARAQPGQDRQGDEDATRGRQGPSN